MAVVEATIASALVDLTDILKVQTDQEQGIIDWSEGLAKIISDAILSADVINVTTAVSTVTVGVSPSGPTSGTGSGTGTQTATGSLI